MNNHPMVTRSQKDKEPPPDENPPEDDKYDYTVKDGNLTDLIDYECDEDFDNEMFQKELARIRRGKPSTPRVSTKPFKNRKKQSEIKMNDMLTSFLTLHLLQQLDPGSPRRGKSLTERVRIKIQDKEMKRQTTQNEESEQAADIVASDDEESEQASVDEESSLVASDRESDITISELVEPDEASDEGSGLVSGDEEILTSGDSDYEIQLDEESAESESVSDDSIFGNVDEYDIKYMEILDSMDENLNEEREYEYFHNLEKQEKINHLEQIELINKISNKEIPDRFKILNSKMDMRTKTMAIHNLDKLSEMDVSTGEYCKMEKWIDGLIKTPFGIYNKLPISSENTSEEKTDYLLKTKATLDKAIYGHEDAKIHILQVIGKWIKNPKSSGNVLAIQGPMGNGKTTLVKEGIAKAINRPFAFIALGGASDSSYFDGHSYTYEGSHWGRIIDILMESKCMNPIIYFDELDKLSETQKGDEIIHLLTHLTDPSQNKLFQDNYYSGIHLDLSKCLFVFSFNDEDKIDRILKDRMYVIRTKGFNPEDKVLISRKYLLPELLSTYGFNENEIQFDDDSLLSIIENNTNKEEGVRNLKRCLETIISKVNIYHLTSLKDSNKGIVNFTIDDFKIPLKLNNETIKKLLPESNEINKPPEHMYL